MDESNGIPATMLVGPTGYGNQGGFGFGGGDWSWILLLVLLCGGGWGGMGFGGGWGGMMGMGFDFPWLLNGQQNVSNNVSDGFRDAQLHDSVTSVRDGVSNLATQLCFNGVQSSLCDIRYGSATNTRDIIDSQTRGTQAILDKLCALELDGYKRENDNLRQQLNMADLRASQTAQNAFISQGFANEVDALYNRLNSCPVPTTPVYGRTPIFTCNGQQGCGCGCGSF